MIRDETTDKYIQHNNRTVFLIGEINRETSMKVIYNIQLLNKESTEPIILQINSGGGSVEDGLAIIDIMRASVAPVYTIALGQAHSMASLILAAGKKGYRKANKNCSILLHQLQTGYQGKFDDVTALYNHVNRLTDIINDSYVTFTGQNQEKIKKDLQSTIVLMGQEAIDYGIIDNII